MEFNNLPEFELDFELENEEQEKAQGQEKAPASDVDDNIDIDEEHEKEDESELKSNYEEGSDDLAIQTYKELSEKGILSDDPNNPFKGTWDSLDEQLATIPQRVLNTLIEETPELGKQVLKFVFSSQNLTKEDLKSFMTLHLESIQDNELSLETADEAREYLQKIYSDRGMRASAVRAALDALEEDDELMEEAKQEYSKESVKAKEKTDKIIADREAAERATQAHQREFVSAVSQELDSIGWTAKKVNDVKQVLSNNKLNEYLQKIVSNPKALIKLADFVTYYNEKDKDIDYSKFTSRAETSKAKGFKEKIEQSINTPNSNTRTSLKNPNSNLEDLIPLVN